MLYLKFLVDAFSLVTLGPKWLNEASFLVVLFSLCGNKETSKGLVQASPQIFSCYRKLGNKPKDLFKHLAKVREAIFVRACKKHAETTILSPKLLFLILHFTPPLWQMVANKEERRTSRSQEGMRRSSIRRDPIGSTENSIRWLWSTTLDAQYVIVPWSGGTETLWRSRCWFAEPPRMRLMSHWQGQDKMRSMSHWQGQGNFNCKSCRTLWHKVSKIVSRTIIIHSYWWNISLLNFPGFNLKFTGWTLNLAGWTLNFPCWILNFPNWTLNSIGWTLRSW